MTSIKKLQDDLLELLMESELTLKETLTIEKTIKILDEFEDD